MGAASRVGALVVLFVACAAGLFFFLGKGLWAARMNEYYVVFDDAGGLNKGANVLLSGVAIGSVIDIGFSDQGKPQAKIAVKKEYALRHGTVAMLPGSFVGIGDKIVQLQPPKDAGTAITPGDPHDPIPGHLMGPLDAMLPDSKETVAEMTRTMAAFRKLLEDPQLKGNINNLMTASTATANKFGGTAERVNGLIDTNQAKVSAIMSSVQMSLRNLEAVSLAVKKVADKGEIEGGVNKLLADLDKAVQSGNKLVNDLSAFTNDPDNQKSLKGTLANVNEMTTSGAKVGKDFEQMSARGVKISENAEVISKNGAEASAKVNDLLTKANKLAD
ncbi:MAG: MlaD family protein, partial [Armatimonadota bacterium]